MFRTLLAVGHIQEVAIDRFRKVMVIGLDGLEPAIIEGLMAAGELPHLARLRERGGLSRVATTLPAQTPVAWSTFATGRNPGGHRIFDFLRRDPATYLPDLALNTYEQKSPFVPPKAINLRQGTPVWKLLDQAGISSTILRCPCTYPPDSTRNRMLSGMGVPDLRGGLGTPTLFTTTTGVKPRESEQVATLARTGDGTVAGSLIGPRSPKDRSDLGYEFTLHPDPAGGRLVLRSGGTPRELVVNEGQWSDWLEVKFKAGMLVGIWGIVRFYLKALRPEVELYASPLNFDPTAPLFPISHPSDYARELADDLGFYYTTGMVEDHVGLKNERLTEEAFLAQCEDVWREREAMMVRELKRFDRGLFYILYDTPDRVQHLFWRFREPDHPANRGRPARPDLARVIDDQYRRGDSVVGKALEVADDQTLVIVLSDHGFSSFQRQVDLNTWLYRNGYLALKDGLEPGEHAGDFLRGVDWKRTRAYAIGLAGLYLNIAGREGQGIVPEGQAESLKAELIAGLTGLVDPQRGVVGINRVMPRESVYSGPYMAEAPDLLLGFNAGYRVSWASSMGGTSGVLFEDNTSKWAGDHIIDPALVPGFLVMNRPFRGEGARLVDLAPTILDALGCAKGHEMEGDSLLS